MTDTIDDALDEILNSFGGKITSDVQDAMNGRPGARTFGVDDDPKGEAKSQLKLLLERVEVEARLAELLNMPFNDGRWSAEWIEKHWAKRIEILQQSELSAKQGVNNE